MQRIGQPYGATVHRRGDIKIFDSDGRAFARVSPHSALQGRVEFGTLGMVLHRVRLGAGVRDHLALRVDDGGASGCLLADELDEFLRRNLALVIHPVGKHRHFLPQSRFGFAAQRILPRPAHQQVERNRRHHDDQQKREKKLNEESVVSLSRTEAVPRSADGSQILRLLGILFDLFAETAHINIDRARSNKGGFAPNRIQ